MKTQDYCHATKNSAPNDVDRAELLKTIMALRQDVNSVATDVQVVLRENAQLKERMQELRAQGKGNKWVSEAQRVRQECDQWVRMHDAAAGGRTRIPEMPRRESPARSAPADTNSWMKKMMMVMMMAELV